VTRARRWARAVADFVIGDDWVAAVGAAAAIGLTAILAGVGIPAWWVLPVAVIAVLGVSLRRAS
jgi:hypothetical protein